MVVLYQSQTYPINPPDATPVLTHAEFWQVMLLKFRKAELFVPPISAYEVLEETDGFMKRAVTFRPGMGLPGGKVTEAIDIRAPWKVDSRILDTGAFVNNTISRGRDETDLHLSFYYEWPFPQLADGSEEAERTSEQLWAQARTTVSRTIDLAREMKRNGELQP